MENVMKKFIIVLAIFVVFFQQAEAKACMDFTQAQIGKSKVQIDFNERNLTAKVCFKVKILKGKKAPKFVGYRYPSNFQGKSSKGKNIRLMKGKKLVGHVMAFNFREGKRHCLTLKLKKGQKKWKRNKSGEFVTYRLPRNVSFHIYRKNVRSYNYKLAHAMLTQKKGKSGATTGSQFFSGSSNTKGGCGSAMTKWPHSKPQAKATDF